MSERPLRPVAIIGAGLAGLSAGMELALRGIPVSIFEQKPFAGGRAYSFVDRTTGETLDNGQHAMIGGYAATLRFLDLLGTRHLLRIQDRPALVFHHPEKGFRRFTLPAIPTPFHLVGGILTTNLFSPRDRLRLLKAGRSILNSRRDEKSIAVLSTAEWLQANGQSAETMRSFWDPLTIAIMNERAERASALLFVRCLYRAFIESTENASLILPAVGLSELFVDPAVASITRLGGRVLLGSGVSEVIVDAGEARGVRLADGSTEEASAVIVAVPPWSFNNLLPDGIVSPGAFEPSPIVSIHFWFEEDFMEEPFVGIIGRTVQWVFNRRKIAEKGGRGGHISCVISAAREIVGRSNEEILQIAASDIQGVFGAHSTPPTRGVVIREKRATFSPGPAIERHRPGAKTSIENLFLAGDWTSTGLPGTIEGAVWSGQLAARLIRA